MTNYCHLSYEERKNIEDDLNDNFFVIDDAFSVASNIITLRKNDNCELSGIP